MKAREERDEKLKALGRIAHELADGASACHLFYELAALAQAAKAYIDKGAPDSELVSCLCYLIGAKADECCGKLEQIAGGEAA
jgi:hypothetical protein